MGNFAVATFAYGIHPGDHKGLAAEAAIEVMPSPSAVSIPLQQHLGAPCEAVVKSREEVEPGTLIGKAGGFVSAPVHASIKGKCAKEAVATLPNARHVASIPIKADDDQPLSGQALYDDIFGGDWPTSGLDQYAPDQIAQAALDAGLVGLGGAAFPTHVKLRRNEEKPIDTLLINGAECEPYLTADYRVMLEAAPAVVCGALLGKLATGAGEVRICIEDNKPKAIEALRQAAAGTDVQVQALKTKYPQGGEKQLIMAALKREVPTGGLPLDVGVVVLNVGTTAALARAVVRGKPLTHRVVTVSGAGIREQKNLLVPIGAYYDDLIAYCGGLTDDAARVISGGPMMGFTLGDLHEPVTKGTSGLTVLTEADVKKQQETTCVRCGRCVDVCPINLVPSKLGMAARHQNVDIAKRYHMMACMECGCCAYICPANIPLVQLMRVGKILVKKG